MKINLYKFKWINILLILKDFFKMNSTKFLSENQQSKRTTSSFLVRKLNQQKSEKDKVIEPRLSIEPSKVEFREFQNSIYKIMLKNQTSRTIQFKIIQPQKSCFRVKVRKNTLLSHQSIDVNVILTIDLITDVTNDVFSIRTAQNIINTPIIMKFSQPFMKQTTVPPSKKQFLSLTKSSKRRKEGKNKKKSNVFHEKINSKRQIHYLFEDFIHRFEQIQFSIRDKSITNQTFIGQKPLGTDKITQFEGYNLKMIILFDKQMREAILNRFSVEFGLDGPTICHLNSTYPKYPRWDFSRNIPRITYEKGMRNLKEKVTEIIINKRLVKLKKIMQIYSSLQAKDKSKKGTNQARMVKKRNSFVVTEHRKFTEKNTIKKMLKTVLQFQDSSLEHTRKHNYFCRKIKNILENTNQSKYGLEFNKFTLSPQTLEIDYETKQLMKTKEFEIQPRIGFDNWVFLEEVARYSHEVMKYAKIDTSLFIKPHAILDSLQMNREGCELEYLRNSSENKSDLLTKTKQNNTFYFDSFHENRSSTNYWVCLKSQSEEYIEQPKQLTQSILKNQYSSIMNSLLYFKQEYFPFYEAGNPEALKKFINPYAKEILFQIDREDRLTLQAFFEQYKSSDGESDKEQDMDKNRQCQQDESNFQRRSLETEQQLYRQIIQNLEKVSLKEKDRNQAILNSFNKFIKNQKYLIVF